MRAPNHIHRNYKKPAEDLKWLLGVEGGGLEEFTLEPEGLGLEGWELYASPELLGERKFVFDKISGGEYILDRPPKKPGGGDMLECDKVAGGEYRLECPPKKPGGMCCVLAPNCKKDRDKYFFDRLPRMSKGLLLFAMLFSGEIEHVEGKSIDAEASFKDGVWRSLLNVTLLAILLGIVLCRKKVLKIWKDFWITMEVYDLFDDKFKEFRGGVQYRRERCPYYMQCSLVATHGRILAVGLGRS